MDAAASSVAVILLVTTMGKLTFGSHQPLWLDEVWTGMIAGQKSVYGLIHQCSSDVNAPLGYLIAWLWAFPSGLSNSALRFPSALFGSLAPLVALMPMCLLDRRGRLTWCALLACWTPAVAFSSGARCYMLVFLLGSLNAVAFARLLSSAETRTALFWATISSLLILAHYVSGVLVACQGLIYLAVYRGRALRTWPAALAFLPAAAWAIMHIAVLAHFSRSGMTGVAPLGPERVPESLGFLLGTPVFVAVISLWAAIGFLVDARSPTVGPADPRRETPSILWLVPAASLSAAGICIVLAVWKPVIVTRYLTPMAPGVLFGAALLAQRFVRSWRLAPAVLIAGYFGVVVGVYLQPGHPGELHGFQDASEALMSERPRAIVFLWDNPTSEGGDPGAFAQIGGFFFRRAGHPTLVDAVFTKPGQDPNRMLLAQAERSQASILWLYDLGVQGTAARAFPPNIERLDARWRCRDFADKLQHVLACSRTQRG